MVWTRRRLGITTAQGAENELDDIDYELAVAGSGSAATGRAVIMRRRVAVVASIVPPSRRRVIIPLYVDTRCCRDTVDPTIDEGCML